MELPLVFENVLFRSNRPYSMKKIITILTLVCSVNILWAQNPSNERFMTVDEVRPGMKGFGRTVFEGTAIQDFQVEILGVLKTSSQNKISFSRAFPVVLLKGPASSRG
jgi:hypothetical protein